MVLLKIAYNETLIHESSEENAVTLNTDGKYMDGDVVVTVESDEPEDATGESF